MQSVERIFRTTVKSTKRRSNKKKLRERKKQRKRKKQKIENAR